MKLLAITTACLFVASAVFARPKPGEHIDPAVAAWFHSLQNPNSKYPCCDVSDCRRVEATVDENGHYRATINREDFDAYDWDQRFGTVPTKEIDVPQKSIVTRSDNPTGSAVLCYGIIAGAVYCFVPYDFME